LEDNRTVEGGEIKPFGVSVGEMGWVDSPWAFMGTQKVKMYGLMIGTFFASIFMPKAWDWSLRKPFDCQ
jgi:hypothetical protein